MTAPKPPEGPDSGKTAPKGQKSLISPQSKVCTRCHQHKPIEVFNKRAAAADGFRSTCKACDIEVRNQWEERQECQERERLQRKAEAERQLRIRLDAERRRALAPASAGPEAGLVEAGGVAPAPPAPAVEGEAEAGARVIGRITPDRVREVATDPVEAEEQAAAREYAEILNARLPIRRRANLMIKIAKNAKGPTAALALQALRDINLATGVTSRTGTQVEVGPLFVMPEGTSMRMKGA